MSALRSACCCWKRRGARGPFLFVLVRTNFCAFGGAALSGAGTLEIFHHAANLFVRGVSNLEARPGTPRSAKAT